MSKFDSRRRGPKGSAGSSPRHVESHSSSHETAGHRHQRLEQLLREEVRSLLRDEVTDPTLEGVRITTVILSVDYKNARIHFTRGGAEPSAEVRDKVARAFVRASPFLRARLAESIDLKRVPDLRFVFDGAAALDDVVGGALEQEPSTAVSDEEDPWRG